MNNPETINTMKNRDEGYAKDNGLQALVEQIKSLMETARSTAAKEVNNTMLTGCK